MFRGVSKLYIQVVTKSNIVWCGMQQRPLCRSCLHIKMSQMEGYSYFDRWGNSRWSGTYTVYSCKWLKTMIHKLRRRCKGFTPLTQTRLMVVKDGMVKLTDIPSEGERVELKDLPKEVECIALSEKMVGQSEGKVGGLVIDFKLRDDRTFSQKYTKVSGAVLFTALKRLKIKDTKDLQGAWYRYALTNMRIGFPRMIPIGKVSTR